MIVVNTCSFIASAQQESVNTILEMAQHKTDGQRPETGRRGLPGGTFPQRNSEEHSGSRCRGRDGRTGRNPRGCRRRAGRSLDSPFNILQSRAEGDARAEQGRFSRETWDGAIADLPNYLYDEATPRVLATPRHTAYIKIAEGCDHPCTFCIIPQLRGKFRSRRFESVIAEAERLALGRARNHADRPGHHLLRRRLRPERWPRPAAGEAGGH